MQVLWERGNINVKELGLYLYLDSGTLTPLLKKLENKKYIKRDRSSKDERNLVISLTEKGKELKKETSHITEEVENSIKGLTKEDKKALNNLLNKMTTDFNKDEE
jgi:DNA-binding MarR family transcriptional regulator